MGQAKSAQLRYKIIEDKSKGDSYAKIAITYGVSYHTVRGLCKRYESDKERGLQPRYKNCGLKVSGEAELVFRLVRLLAYIHPTWGIAYILCKIRNKFPDLPLQSERTYQRRINRKVSKMPAAEIPKAEPVGRARCPHDVWQIDAKERFALSGEASGKGCFLNFTDEKTSSLLHAEVFPPRLDMSGTNIGYSQVALDYV